MDLQSKTPRGSECYGEQGLGLTSSYRTSEIELVLKALFSGESCRKLVYHLNYLSNLNSLLQYDIWLFFSEILTNLTEPLIPGPYLRVFREAGWLFRFTQTSLRIMLGTMCFTYVIGDHSMKCSRAPSCCWNRRFANCSSIGLYISLAPKLNAHKSSEATG